MSYGELYIPPERPKVNPVNGRFLKGHVPANKGKKWSDYMPKRSQRRASKGWKNLDKHRCRPLNAGRNKRPVIAMSDDYQWCFFPSISAAAEWCKTHKSNIGRCCRLNASGTFGNTNHRCMGVRFYFEDDPSWIKKVEAHECAMARANTGY